MLFEEKWSQQQYQLVCCVDRVIKLNKLSIREGYKQKTLILPKECLMIMQLYDMHGHMHLPLEGQRKKYSNCCKSLHTWSRLITY